MGKKRKVGKVVVDVVVVKWGWVVRWLLLVGGLAGFGILCHNDFNQGIHQQDNSMIAGLAQSEFGRLDVMAVGRMHTSMSALPRNSTEIATYIKQVLGESGLETHTFCGVGGDCVDAIYSIVFSSRGSGTEALLLHTTFDVPENLHATATALQFALYANSRHYWQKDVVVLFTSGGHLGMKQWLDAYTNGDLPVISRYVLHGGLSIDLRSQKFDHFELALEGYNGLMPNMDHVMTALARLRRVCASNQCPEAYPRASTLVGVVEANARALGRALWQQMTCMPRGLHALLLTENIPSYTLIGRHYKGKAHQQQDASTFLDAIHLVLRALNNMTQRFNLSFLFYIVLSGSRFVSIGRYLPPLGCAVASVLVAMASLAASITASLPITATPTTKDNLAHNSNDDLTDNNKNITTPPSPSNPINPIKDDNPSNPPATAADNDNDNDGVSNDDDNDIDGCAANAGVTFTTRLYPFVGGGLVVLAGFIPGIIGWLNFSKLQSNDMWAISVVEEQFRNGMRASAVPLALPPLSNEGRSTMAFLLRLAFVSFMSYSVHTNMLHLFEEKKWWHVPSLPDAANTSLLRASMAFWLMVVAGLQTASILFLNAGLTVGVLLLVVVPVLLLPLRVSNTTSINSGTNNAAAGVVYGVPTFTRVVCVLLSPLSVFVCVGALVGWQTLATFTHSAIMHNDMGSWAMQTIFTSWLPITIACATL